LIKGVKMNKPREEEKETTNLALLKSEKGWMR